MLRNVNTAVPLRHEQVHLVSDPARIHHSTDRCWENPNIDKAHRALAPVMSLSQDRSIYQGHGDSGAETDGELHACIIFSRAPPPILVAFGVTPDQGFS
jgi:hypothetical protein